MTTDDFIDRAELLWPGKGLTLDQRILYRDKMRRFTSQEIAAIFEQTAEASKFFPKVADIFEAAQSLGYLARTDTYQPHRWVPGDCRLCGGSGQIAAFYEILLDYENGVRELRLQRVMQYESSEGTVKVHPNWSRYFFRCCCPQGIVPTLPKGWPQWDLQKSTTLRFNL